jgi:hypothetical protein
MAVDQEDFCGFSFSFSMKELVNVTNMVDRYGKKENVLLKYSCPVTSMYLARAGALQCESSVLGCRRSVGYTWDEVKFETTLRRDTYTTSDLKPTIQVSIVPKPSSINESVDIFR